MRFACATLLRLCWRCDAAASAALAAHTVGWAVTTGEEKDCQSASIENSEASGRENEGFGV